MSHKEVFLFDENSAIKKIDSEPNLTDNEKNIHSDLKENKKDIKKTHSDLKENKKDIHSDLKENKKDIFVDKNDPFFFS